MEEINDRWALQDLPVRDVERDRKCGVKPVGGRDGSEIWHQFGIKAGEKKKICDVGGRGQDNKLAMRMVRYQTNGNGTAEGGDKENSDCLSASEGICPRRSMPNQCRSAIK